ncbi:hypothetical protein ADEAN_000143500 [Angomonas deanei]|uniref:Uncharacterized protein n=1 Tax=Angomonas deanei TaxID=59799 RepID=A0A7G2C476_9TRYP|nr:hypothetical protein ADEAN_000143500 [Angomonas deanei]
MIRSRGRGLAHEVSRPYTTVPLQKRTNSPPARDDPHRSSPPKPLVPQSSSRKSSKTKLDETAPTAWRAIPPRLRFRWREGDSSSTRQSSPPLIPPHRKSESPQYNASERSISFQVEGSVPQIPRNASPPRSISPPIANGVSNESIAFHVENDRNSSDNERSRGNLFVPLRDKAIHDGDESVAFQSVNNSFANVPAAFNDNTSIAFQMHDLPSTSIPTELPRPRKVSPTIAEKKVNQSAQSFASTGDDSIAFQVEDGSALYGKLPALLTQSANTSTVYDPIPLGDTRPHAGEDTGDDDFTMSPGLLSSTRVNKPVTKKTIVSNRLQTRSKDTSPVLKRLQLSPPPQKTEGYH